MNEQLYHYGVPGMKWGIRRAIRKERQNARLERKAAQYDLRAAKAKERSEWIHSTKDLKRYSNVAAKANKYSVRSARYAKRALAAKSDRKRLRLEQKSAAYKYMADQKMIKSNRLAKQVGYGRKAMNLSTKSDKLAAKASRVRLKIAGNNRYQGMIDRRMNSLSESDIATAKAYMEKLRSRA